MMRIPRKLLTIFLSALFVLSLIPFSYAAEPHVEFDVGEYLDGKVTVSAKFVDCVGLTAGFLAFAYPDGEVMNIVRKSGADAKNVGDIDNVFSSEFNSGINPAEFSFYFKRSLWDNAEWKEAADKVKQTPYVNGERFEFALFTFTTKENVTVNVSGKLRFGGKVVPFNYDLLLGHIHNWDGGKVTRPATCAKEGVMVFTCLECGATSNKAIQKTAHRIVIDQAVPATCTADGKTEGSHCAACGEIMKAQTVIKATGHQWGIGELTTLPTCAKEGVMTYTCNVCSATKTQPIAKLTEHTWDKGVVTTAATAEKEGVKTFTCTVCGTVKTEKIPALEPVEKKMMGDIDDDGRITPADARLALRASVRLFIIPENSALFTIADVNKDNKIGSDDARLILRASVNLEDYSKW